MSESTSTHPAPKRIAVAYHPRIAEAAPTAAEVAACVREAGAQAEIGTLSENIFQTSVASGRFDLVVTLGGDGTMLRAAHACARAATPILGINLGTLGFLTEFHRTEWRAGMAHILRGDYWIETRMMLKVRHARGGDRLGDWDVLNECAVTRGSKMIRLETAIDTHAFATYAADGLIAATATGSTAYALAAGGPILPPDLRNILLVPVAPHLSVERAIVLAEGAEVSIVVRTESQAALSCDGRASVAVLDGDRVDVCAADCSAAFARVQGRGYFYRNVIARLNRDPGTKPDDGASA